jgi:hypothetical protein
MRNMVEDVQRAGIEAHLAEPRKRRRPPRAASGGPRRTESTTGRRFLPSDEATPDYNWCECQGTVAWRFRYFTSSGGR